MMCPPFMLVAFMMSEEMFVAIVEGEWIFHIRTRYEGATEDRCPMSCVTLEECMDDNREPLLQTG